MNIHDSGYKRLFRNRTIFRQLIESYVEEEWVALLDFARAEVIDKSFVTEHYKETEADLIYKVPLKAAKQRTEQGVVDAIYFYLLIEFQSTVDRFMVVRVGHYLLSFYLDYCQTQQGVRQLPQIMPIVLYNGSERWTAATLLSELMEKNIELNGYGLETSYFPIIINEQPLEKLLAEANIVTTLFLAEAYYDANLVVSRLLDLYEAADRQAVSLLANWFLQMRVYKRIPTEDYALLEREYRSREELQSMIVEAILKEEEQTRNRIAEAVRKEVEAVKKEVVEAVKKEEEQIRKESEAKGKTERNREIAQAMLAEEYPLAVIAHLLGLAEDEVQELLADPQVQM
jgi:predicted transposase/invertase (TIGR01784 family)